MAVVAIQEKIKERPVDETSPEFREAFGSVHPRRSPEIPTVFTFGGGPFEPEDLESRHQARTETTRAEGQ